MSVVVASAYRAFGDATALRLGREHDLEVIGVANATEETVSLVEALHPDIVVLDFETGSVGAVQLTQVLRRCAPDTRAIVLSRRDSPVGACLAFSAGAAGFVPKDASLDQLVTAIRTVARGDTWVSQRLLRDVFENLLDRSYPPPDGLLARLTRRELEVLRCLVSGRSRTAIASELFVSKNTVRTHISNILGKLGVHSMLEAIAVAHREGLRGDAKAAVER